MGLSWLEVSVGVLCVSAVGKTIWCVMCFVWMYGLNV